MSHPLPTSNEIEQHLELAARGVVRAGGLSDRRWEPILIGVAHRGVVTAADRRAAQTLLTTLERETAPDADPAGDAG